jgi:hypothetical protein
VGLHVGGAHPGWRDCMCPFMGEAFFEFSPQLLRIKRLEQKAADAGESTFQEEREAASLRLPQER